jgi:hypothetical protein
LVQPVAFLLAATFYQGNHDRDHKLWNIRSTERYILHTQALLEVATYKWKIHNGKFFKWREATTNHCLKSQLVVLV